MSRLGRIARAILPLDRCNMGKVSIDDKHVVFLEVSPQGGLLGYSPGTIRAGIRLQRFAVESILILVGYSCLWYVLWSTAASNSALTHFLRGLFLPFSLQTMLWIDLTIFSFFGLVFYGTASEITPLRLLSVIFQPLVSFYRRRSLRIVTGVDVGSSEDCPTAERSDGPKLTAAQATETAVVEFEEKGSENAIPAMDVLPARVGSDEEEQPDDLFKEVSVRASFLATRMEKRTNTYIYVKWNSFGAEVCAPPVPTLEHSLSCTGHSRNEGLRRRRRRV